MKSVKMVREEPMAPGGPVTADVHPGEVEAWTLYGWVIAPGDTSTPPDPKPDKADKSKGKTKAADAADGDTSTP